MQAVAFPQFTQAVHPGMSLQHTAQLQAEQDGSSVERQRAALPFALF